MTDIAPEVFDEANLAEKECAEILLLQPDLKRLDELFCELFKEYNKNSYTMVSGEFLMDIDLQIARISYLRFVNSRIEGLVASLTEEEVQAEAITARNESIKEVDAEFCKVFDELGLNKNENSENFRREFEDARMGALAAIQRLLGEPWCMFEEESEESEESDEDFE